jgi:hypothetical protein
MGAPGARGTHLGIAVSQEQPYRSWLLTVRQACCGAAELTGGGDGARSGSAGGATRASRASRPSGSAISTMPTERGDDGGDDDGVEG